jgi:2,7-dihydroxy-5-methyl-1-naphthoate 7-O-methyltransferase
MPEQKKVSLEDLADLCTPWCIHTVATLRIAEHIAAGKNQINDLAAAAGCDPYSLHRVLTYLAGKGVFEEASPGRFELNETAQGLLDPSVRLGLDLNGIGGRMAYAWGTLPTYVRMGKPGYQELFGLPFWEDLEAHPEVSESFDELIGPAGHGTPNPNFEITGGWEAARHVVDVGGGTGAMLAEILRARPWIRGTLVDLPRTVARSSDIFQASGVADRVTAVGQTFFDPLPSGADVYLLKSVINDWPDEETVAILSRCADAARRGGRVVVLGGITLDEAPRALVIEMVLLAGRQRTVSEFSTLASRAGLKVSTAERQPSGHFVVECLPSEGD